jgi:hypothetical protein
MDSNFYLYGVSSKSGRALRFIIGGALIAITMLDPVEPIGWSDIYALIAIPIVVSAAIGWDPLVAIYRSLTACFRQQKQSALPVR